MPAGSRRGRFAPSPTGPLHAGSLVAALASWLDVRARGAGARWLVRIEDTDTGRCLPGMDALILGQLDACGLRPDEPPVRQSVRGARYQAALRQLEAAGMAYPCGCSRKDIESALAQGRSARPRHAELVYPGTCRNGLHGKPARAWRFAVSRCPRTAVTWVDRRLGVQSQDVADVVGDFVLRRADGPWAYQLAVVVDDAEQGITDVVRGQDLADNTARQRLLQEALGLPAPSYLHVPLVLGADGHKLSKQNGARALDTATPAAALAALETAAATLGLTCARGAGNGIGEALARWVGEWRDLYNPPP